MKGSAALLGFMLLGLVACALAIFFLRDLPLTPPPPAPAKFEDCVVLLVQANFQAWVNGPNGKALCADMIKTWSGNGLLYRLASQSDLARGAGGTMVCRLRSGETTITIYDTGVQIYGVQTCGNLVHAGWVQQ